MDVRANGPFAAMSDFAPVVPPGPAGVARPSPEQASRPGYDGSSTFASAYAPVVPSKAPETGNGGPARMAGTGETALLPRAAPSGTAPPVPVPQPAAPSLPDLWPMLHDYQKIAMNFLLTHLKAGLFLDVGFGKTLVTLATLVELARQGQLHGHVLVIAPKAIARSTWIDEMVKWGIPANRVSLIVNARGKQLTRRKRLEIYGQIASSPPSFYFLNRELVRDIVDWHFDNRLPWPFRTIVVDELQGFKSYSADRFKALKSVAAQTDRFIGLTGTPSPKGLEDLWAEICLMDDGLRLGRTITAYRNTFFYPGLVVNGRTVTWNPKQGAEEAIYDAIRDVVVSVKNTDLKLPDITYNDFRVYMSDEEYQVYKDFMKEKVLDVMNEDGTQSSIEAKNAAILTAKLSQLASGCIYTGNGKEYAVLHQHKLEALEYIVNNTGSPVLVAYYFQSDRAEIQKYLAEKKIPCEVLDGSPEMIHRWNAGDIPVMLLQPASVGHGINIQDGGHTLVWYTIPWSLEHYVQTVGRLHRQGQKFPVVVHHLMTDKTIDRRILKRVNEKDQSERALMDAVSAYIADVVDE